MDNDERLTEALVAGVDGCRAGWICVVGEVRSDGLNLEVLNLYSAFSQLIEATTVCRAVCVDMPIGLSHNGRREADFEARRLIGPRRSSVFPPPARAVLEAGGDYETLNALSKSIRAGLSRQTYNIIPKMHEVDGAMTPALQSRVRESHPEVSFCALKGDCLRHAKHTREGHRERLALLGGVFGPTVRDWRAPTGAALDDLYDAAVLAWTAARVVRGEARTLPSEPGVDARGLRMEIVY